MSFAAVIVQMFILNIVFSIDSVITAIGMANEIWVMMTAVIASVFVMLFAAEPISHFVQKHPTIKILALSFLLLIGASLIAEGIHYHIPKGTIYFSMAFAFTVNMIQLKLHPTQHPPVNLHERYSDKDEESKIDMV
jgi:predicted tellurium resistance membrane protein TerC